MGIWNLFRYRINTTATLTGVLILDDQNNPDAVFIFQIGTTLTTSGNGEVRRAGNTNSSIIFWQVGDSANLSSTVTFRGTILALNSITLNNLAKIDGRALARNGAVILNNNNLVEVPQVIRLVNLTQSALANGTDKLTMMVTVTNPPPQGPISDNVFLSSNRIQDAFDVPANQVVTNAAGQAVFNVTSTLPGIAKITATTGKNTVSTIVLFLGPPALTTINVTPASAAVVVGNTTNFTAATLDQLGNAFPAIVTWNSSNITVGTIDAAGMFTALAPGTTTITAFNGTVLGTATAIVTATPVVRGDVNAIQGLDVGDVLFTAQFVAGVRTPTTAQAALADVNAIQGLDVGDVLFVAQAVAGLRTLV